MRAVVLACFFLSGASGLILEMLWTGMLTLKRFTGTAWSNPPGITPDWSRLATSRLNSSL